MARTGRRGGVLLRGSVLRLSPALRQRHGFLVLAATPVAILLGRLFILLASAVRDNRSIGVLGFHGGNGHARVRGVRQGRRVLLVGMLRWLLWLLRQPVRLIIVLLGWRSGEGTRKIGRVEPGEGGRGMVELLEATRRIRQQVRRLSQQDTGQDGSNLRVMDLTLGLFEGLSGRWGESGILIRLRWGLIEAVIHRWGPDADRFLAPAEYSVNGRDHEYTSNKSDMRCHDATAGGQRESDLGKGKARKTRERLFKPRGKDRGDIETTGLRHKIHLGENGNGPGSHSCQLISRGKSFGESLGRRLGPSTECVYSIY